MEKTIRFTHDHIHLRCRDVDATARFYGETLGGRVLKRPGSGPKSITEVSLAGLRLFLSPAPADDVAEPERDRSPLGVWQLSFGVEDLDSAIRNLKAKGVVFPEDAVVLASGARVAFFEGPDSVEIELIQRPDKSPAPIDQDSSGQRSRRDR